MDDHQEDREPAAGDSAGEAEPAEQDATDNPLARIDPDSDVVADAAAAKGGVNDPADDPLWNPAMEPQGPQAPKGTKQQQDQPDQQDS